MRIVLSSNFDIAGLLGKETVELQEGASIGSLFEMLRQQCQLNLIDLKSGEINSSDFRVLLNGIEHPFWPRGLATPLRNADEVRVLVMPLAGG